MELVDYCRYCGFRLNRLITKSKRNFCGDECYKEYRREYKKEYFKINYPKIRERKLKYNRIYKPKWYQKNKVRVREYYREYVKKLLKKNPDYFIKYVSKFKYNYFPYKGLSIETYKKITEKCVIKDCGFSLTVDLHHIDKNKANNKISNLIGLCPSHHMVIHRLKYKLASNGNSRILTK